MFAVNCYIQFLFHFITIADYSKQAVVRYSLICTWHLDTASLLRSATYIGKHAGANQIGARLPARCCSQPVSQLLYIYCLRSHWPTWGHSSKSLGLSAHIFGKMSLFVMTTP